MKYQKQNRWDATKACHLSEAVLGLVLLFGLSAGLRAAAPPIGANFQGNPNGNPSTLTSGESAGAFVQANWNNIDNNANGNKSTSGALNDGSGTPTTVTLSYNASDNWFNDETAGTSPDFRLMRGIIKAANNAGQPDTFFSFNNVPAGAYDLYVYVNVNGDGRLCDITCQNVTYYIQQTHQFGGTYIQAKNLNPSGPRDTGNYVVFQNVIPKNGVIAFDQFNRVFNRCCNLGTQGDGDGSGMAAAQLVPKDAGPVFVDQLPADAQHRYAGEKVIFRSSAALGTPPYTYQWFTNGVVDPTATASSYTLAAVATSDNGRTFQVVATDSATLVGSSRIATLQVDTANPTNNISVNNVGRNGTFRLQSTDTAGVVPLQYWNSAPATGVDDPPGNGDVSGLTNSAGQATTVTMHWDANDAWSGAGGSSGPNNTMMIGFTKLGNPQGTTGDFIFHNLPREASYDIYLYTSVNNGGSLPGNVRYNAWVTSQGDRSSGTVAITNYSMMPDGFNGTFGAAAVNYNPAGPYPGGYYTKFTNVLTTPSGDLTIGAQFVSGGDGAGFPGIQLIRRTDVVVQTLNLVSGALTQTPSPQFDGSQYTLSGPNVQGVGVRSYQWQTNTANDLSGTWVNVTGANQPTYSSVPLFTENGKQFRVIVGNLFPSSVTSAPIALNLIQDITSPTLARTLGAAYRTNVTLIFSEGMLSSEAATLGNYAITNAAGATLAISGVSVSADGKEVSLTTASQTPGAQYFVVVSGLHDRAFVPNVIAPNPSIGTFTASDLTFVPGVALFRAYAVGGGNQISLLTGNPLFPNSPDFFGPIAGFNSRLATNPAAPTHYNQDARETYGATIVGHFIAPSSGNWIFYIAGDDDVQLLVNTNGPTAAGKVELKYVPSCCHALSADPSVPVALIAGQAYYAETLMKEGTGGDYVQLGARKVGDASSVVPLGSANIAFGYSLIITQQPPANVTNYQNQFVTFTVGVRSGGVGITPLYQWQQSDSSGTAFTNLPGATSASFTYVSPLGDDLSQFRCVVSLPSLTTVTSSAVILHVIPDLDPPVLLSVTTDDGFNKVVLTWNETMDPGADVSAFTLNGPNGDPGVLSVVVSGTKITITTISLLDQNSFYTLDYGPVLDLAGNPAYGNTSFTTRTISRGFTKFQAYTSIGTVSDGNNLNFLFNNANYPNNPSFSFVTNQVNWPQTVNPNIESYGMRFSGLFIAPVDGSYTFKSIHDDGAIIYFSTDTSPANKVQILSEGCCNGGYTGGNSAPVSLLAGQRYYYELVVLEGGGGDYAGLGVNLPVGGFVAPVPASMLALSYAGGATTGAGIAQQPVNASIEENHSATFSVVVTNIPDGAFYQWQLNNGGGFNNIVGANSATYTTPTRVLANNNDQYRVIVYVPGVTFVSSVATLTVINDTTKPTVVRARSDRGSTNLIIRFSEIVSAVTAQNPANYALTNAQGDAIALGTPVLSGDSLTVTIPTLSNLGYGSNYTVHVEGVQDIAGTANTMNPTNIAFKTWTVGLGSLIFDVYGGLDASQTLPAFTNNPAYPDSPTVSTHIASADSRRFYPDDSHEGYGGRMSGYLVPPINGNYTFYLGVDDDGEVRLSPDNNANNRAAIIFAPSCCAAFSAHPSSSISLLGGQPYAFELVYKEGTGGDYGQVAAKLTADPTNPDILPTINGAYLSSLADPVGASITITQQPVSTNVVSTATLRVGLTSTNDYGDYNQIAYQWQQYNGVTWDNVLQANAATYTTTPLGAGETRQYRCIVYIPGANATSTSATVNGPGVLKIVEVNAATSTLSWTGGGILQQADEIIGPWTDSGNQSNPQSVSTAPGTKKFYKLR